MLGQSNSNSDELRGMGYIQSICTLFSSVSTIGKEPGGWAGAFQAFNISNIGRQFEINTLYTNMTNASKSLINGLSLGYLIEILITIASNLMAIILYGRFYGVGTIVSKFTGMAVSVFVSTAIWGLLVFLVSRYYDQWQTMIYKIAVAIIVISSALSIIWALKSLVGLLTFSTIVIIAVAGNVLRVYANIYMLNGLTMAIPYTDGAETGFNTSQQAGFNAGSSSKWKRDISGETPVIYCPHCGAEVVNGNDHCGCCGTEVK